MSASPNALPVDPAAVSAAMAAIAAKTVMPRFNMLAAHEIRTKTSADDLVTAADLECQDLLAAELRALLPAARIVGEEGGGYEEEACGAIAAAEWCWVIDPVDGTHNFVHGRPGFSVMVALVHRGLTMAAWIHDPAQAVTTHAVAGGGAWQAGKRLQVAAARPLKQMTGVLYIGAKRAPALNDRFKVVREQLGPLSFQRAAGAEYLGLAEGRLHYAIFTRLLPWDHAPGALIYAEAGGHMAYIDTGEPYRPVAARPVPMLLAPDAETWRSLQAFFAPTA